MEGIAFLFTSLGQESGIVQCVPANPLGQPEVWNTLLNSVAIIVTSYVIYITRKLDKEVRHGGE